MSELLFICMHVVFVSKCECIIDLFLFSRFSSTASIFNNISCLFICLKLFEVINVESRVCNIE